VVNRVLAGEELLEKSRHFAARLAAGPTIAHAATKAVVRAQSDHGTRGADDRTAQLTSTCSKQMTVAERWSLSSKKVPARRISPASDC
jgi:enoyl-CoA hydratase/carnithine racemase